ncbi:hypothetical protein BFP72_14960 [Reichenbachiella sp. 5M10]|uniref:glycosyltransferase family 2 protein n=1 Tax=Reichenbachiella sp. 5M10 TaxID=1889772 RepID=UPI000C148ABF|nr:glycosyltransferase family 2 protein [Reichenbachiella sp. 5M10]PIB36608.1 hypothetical protein BFP72_14960 [Reichenbachiella sp. 5M10]
MTISVIIPTYNRCAQLTSLVDAVENQNHKEFELVLLNDGSSDNTRETLDRLAKKSTLNVKVIHSQNLGRSKARNLAVSKSSGELLVFFDDDVRPNPDAVYEHLSIHQQHDSPVIAGGPYYYDNSKFTNSFNTFRKYMEDQWYSKDSTSSQSDSLRINGGNFSITREAFDKIGGFDSRLTDKEDFKLAYDAFHYHNIPTFSAPKTWVYHDDFRNLVDYIARGRESRIEEQKLRSLDPSIADFDPNRFQIEAPKSLKFRLAKRIFRSTPILQLVEKALDIRIVPQKIAFKLYDICITVNVQYLK